MNEMIKMVVVLTVLSSFSGGLLAALRDGTKEQIESQELELVKGPAVREILEGASNDPITDRFKIKLGEEEKSIFAGVFEGNPNTIAFETMGKGYGGQFGLIVGVNVNDDKIVGVRVTTHKETPGLGGNAKDDPDFATQFSGISIKEPFAVTNDGGSVNAISGATITSRGVCAALTQAGKEYQELKPELVEKLKGLSK